MTFKTWHRYISLIFATLWLFQAGTGCLIVFRWELDDAAVAGHHVAFDPQKIGQKLDAMAGESGFEASSMWASGRAADRFDISYTRNGQDRAVRVDGTGRPLRDRSNDGLDQGNIYDRLSDLHMALMQGDAGRWFIGLSGLVLLSNIALGLKLAWPRAGMWLKALRPPKAKAAPAFLYGWHRLLGLWLAAPAILTILAGTLLAFDDPLASLFHADVPEPVSAPAVVGQPIPPSVALARALATFPGSTLSGFSFPHKDAPWYKVRLHAPGEMPRIWGMTTVFVSARTGDVLGTYDARQAHAPARFMLDVIYPLHTGQIAGIFGRVVQLLIGAWLMAMIVFGISLWWTRRNLTKKPKGSSQA